MDAVVRTWASANLKWSGPGWSIDDDVDDLEDIAAAGATHIGVQECRLEVLDRFLARNPGWLLIGHRNRPAYRVVAILVRRDVVSSADYRPVAVPIGWLGRKGAGEDTISVKILTVARLVDAATGQPYLGLNHHGVVSADNAKMPLAERTRRLAARTRQVRAFFGAVAAARAAGMPAIGGGDWNAVISKLAGLITRGWTWAKTGPTAGGRAIDLVGGAGVVLSNARTLRTTSDHLAVLVDFTLPTPTAPGPTNPEDSTMAKLVDKIIAVAKKEIGTHEGRSGGHWNNHQKYSPAVPGLEWSQNQAWCATFVSWVALTAGAASLYPRTASCDVAGAWFKKAGRWSEYPAIGAQVFFGVPSDLSHTGIVIGFDADTITTVEGNTNNTGSREGDGVYLMRHQRRSPRIIGYGYPAFPEGIVSADPAWQKAAPPKGEPVATQTWVQLLVRDLLTALDKYEPKISKSRPAARAAAKAVRVAVLALKKFA